jgi:hypothetical protein
MIAFSTEQIDVQSGYNWFRQIFAARHGWILSHGAA